MNKKISTLLRYCLIILSLPVLITMQSCKSDEEDLINEFYNFEGDMVMTFGETRNVMTLKKELGEDILVLPAAVSNLSVTSENKKIVRINYDGELEAVGIGTVDIIIRNYEDDEIKRLYVTVNPPYPLKDIPDVLELRQGEEFSLFDTTENPDYHNVIKYLTVESSDMYDGPVYIAHGYVIQARRVGEVTVTVSYAGQDQPVRRFTVRVVPTAVLTMKSGDTDELSNYTSQTNYTSSNNKVVTIKDGKICALNPGKATLSGNYSEIQVTVDAFTNELLFPIPYLPNSVYSPSTDAVKKGMGSYNPAYEGDEEFDGTTYFALRYGNYGNGCTLTYYFEKQTWGVSLKHIILKSSKSADYTYRYLLSEHEINYMDYSREIESFYCNKNSYYWYIYKYGDSWDTLEFKQR